MKKTNASSVQLRNGLLFGIAVVLIAGWVEWHGWAGTRFQAIDDLVVGGVLLLGWLAWESYRLYVRARPKQ